MIFMGYNFKNILKLVLISLTVLISKLENNLFAIDAQDLSSQDPSLILQDPKTVTSEESHLHRLYLKYNSQPTNAELWTNLVEQKQTYTYKVLKGDTLWEISKTLFGDGFFWSKVWSLNPKITNPHQISVGKIIEFRPGSGMNSPGLNILNEGEVVVGYEAFNGKLPPSATHPAMNLNGLSLPPPLKKRMPALKNIPSSLPSWTFNTKKINSTEKVEFNSLKRKFYDSMLSLNYYITENTITNFGTISETEVGSDTASTNDFIFINSRGAILTPGKKFTVIKKMGTIKDPEYDFMPIMVEIQGEVVIVSQKGEYVKAKIINNISPVEVGSLIVEMPIPHFNMDNTGSIVNHGSTIIGGDFDLRRKVLGYQSVVFLNRGTKEGLRIGNRLYLNANHKTRNPLTAITGNYWRNGIVKIIYAEENYSTAVILENYDEIRPGDFTGSAVADDVTDFVKDEAVKSSLNEAHDASFEKGVEEENKNVDENLDSNTESQPEPQSESESDTESDSESDSVSETELEPEN